MTYVPSRFKKVMPESSERILELWSNLFVGEFTYPETLPAPRKTDSLRRMVWELIKSYVTQTPVLLDTGHCHAFTDVHPNTIKVSLELHGIKYNNPAGLTAKDSKDPRIAMHVRRGLSWEPNFTPNRLTGDDEVLRNLKLVSRVERINTGTLYSAIRNEYLESRIPNGFDFDWKANEFEVIHDLINSNVIIMAKSCLSYISATFAQGTVYYDDFFHPPLSGWVSLKTLEANAD
jgi:hypothetical protein